MKRILMIIAQKIFRDEELLEPKKIFEESGQAVTIASVEKGACLGKLGARVEADIRLSDVKGEDYDAVVFVGGSGSEEYFDDLTAHKIAREFHKKNKIVGAICAAPTILARAGLLDRKNATSYIDQKENITRCGAFYKDQAIVVDGNIITGNGPMASIEFANAILKNIL